jgi:hypothetical protein
VTGRDKSALGKARAEILRLERLLDDDAANLDKRRIRALLIRWRETIRAAETRYGAERRK